MPDGHHTKTKVLPGIRNRLQMNEHVSVSSICPSRSVLFPSPPYYWPWEADVHRLLMDSLALSFLIGFANGGL